MTNTALSAKSSEITQEVTFSGQKHKDFYLEYLPKCRYQDTLCVNEEVLHDLAMENTLRELPATFRSMKEVMKEMFIGNLPEMQGDEEMEDFLQALLSEDDAIQDEHVSMYVLSNSEKMNGAAVLF